MTTIAPTDLMSDKIIADLAAGKYSCSHITRLDGGSANFTYRGFLNTPFEDGDGKLIRTIIVKHAEPYIATAQSWPLDPARADFEQTMLKALEKMDPVLHENLIVTTPKIYHFDPESHTSLMSDYDGSLELKKYISTHAGSLADESLDAIGTAMGKWLKAFHLWAKAPEQEELRNIMQGNVKMVKLKHYINFGRLEETIPMFPTILEGSRQMFKEIDETLKAEESEDKPLIHGDFWSGNVLLKDQPTIPTDVPLTLNIIDFELSQLNSLQNDLGQCCAELWFLSHFKGNSAGTQLITAFLRGYGAINDKMAFRAALHFGVHCIIWPVRVRNWGTGEILEQCVETGREMMTKAWKEERSWFKGGILSEMFYPTSAPS